LDIFAEPRNMEKPCKALSEAVAAVRCTAIVAGSMIVQAFTLGADISRNLGAPG
jgi:hypothetical protein